MHQGYQLMVCQVLVQKGLLRLQADLHFRAQILHHLLRRLLLRIQGVELLAPMDAPAAT